MKFNIALFGLLATATLVSAITVTESTGALQLANTLLANQPGLTLVGTPVLTGHTACAGIFADGAAAAPDLGFPDQGFVLSTGSAIALENQDGDKNSVSFKEPGDADLLALGGKGRNGDACALELEFDFECTAIPCVEFVEFEYVWGSEEYNEFVNRNFNDAFAWFLNGNNIAILPSGDRVSIDTVNMISNSDSYVNNDPRMFDPVPYPAIEADGFTVPLKAVGPVNIGRNKLKLVLADYSDLGLDSWALFKKESLVVPPIPPPPTPPSPVVGGGDPHFMRWGQANRDTFHGECDLVVMHSENFHNQAGLDFHIRTTLFNDLYSYIESAAIRIGQDVLEIHSGSFVLNGAKYEDADLPVEFGEYYKFEIAKMQNGPDGDVRRRAYRLHLEDGHAIDFKFYKHLMTYQLVGHSDFAGSLGMVGAYPTGEMIGRDGRSMDNYIDLGFEWQVNLEDPILFADLRAPQLPYERCRVPSQTAQTNRRRLRGVDNKLFADAREACASVTGSDFELCVDDVMMTGDLELAQEW